MGPAPPHAQGAELTPQPWSMVCSDHSMGTLGVGAGQGRGSSSASELGAPSLLLRGSRQKQHSCTHFPYLLSWRWAPRGLGLQSPAGPRTLPGNHPACHRPTALQHQQCLALHPLPACPKLCGAPAQSLASPGERPTCQHALLSNPSPAPYPSVPLPPSPTVPRLMLLSSHLVWVRMTWPLSPGGSLHPAGTETSAAVSPPRPAARHT